MPPAKFAPPMTAAAMTCSSIPAPRFVVTAPSQPVSMMPPIANAIKTAMPKIPIMTVDADLKKEDSALRKTYLGAANDLMGFRLGEYLKKAQPKGGTVCFIEGNAAADNILRRASGSRDSLSGKKGLDRLNGEGGWTEIPGCPVFTNDDGAKGVQAMSDMLTANPKLNAFVIEGGWPLFGAPQPYRQLTDQYKKRMDDKSLTIVAADTIGDEVPLAKEGRVEALVGQRPFEMGHKTPTVMIDLIEGKKVADPVFTGLDECIMATADACIQK